MSDCAAPRHDGQPEPTLTRPGSALCWPCERGLASDLRRLPRLHADLEHIPAAMDGDGSGLPFSEPAAECRDQIRHDLFWWTAQVIKERRAALPFSADWNADEIPVLCGWLAGQAQPPRPWIPVQPWAPDMAGAFASDRARAVALLDPWVTKQFEIPDADGACLDCGEGRMQVTVYVYAADHRKSFIGCTACEARWEFGGAWLPFVRQVLRRRSMQETCPA